MSDDAGKSSAGEPTVQTLDPAKSAGAHPQSAPGFDQVYSEHHDFVWRNVQRLGIPDEAVDDAVQEVFLVVARKLDTFEGRSAIRTWLFAILVRVVKHQRRGRMRHERFRKNLAEHSSSQTGPQAYNRTDAARTLHRLLEKLDEKKRHVFILSELEEMTGPEISAALGVNLPTIYARLRAAKLELAKAAERLEARDARSDGPPLAGGNRG